MWPGAALGTSPGARPGGIAAQFRGGEIPGGSAVAVGTPLEEEEVPSLQSEWRGRSQGLNFPKPLKEMILTTHVHVMMIGVLLLLTGALFLCSGAPAPVKSGVVAGAFGTLLLDYSFMWLTRYASPGFSWGVMISGGLNSLLLSLQLLWVIVELLLPRQRINSRLSR